MKYRLLVAVLATAPGIAGAGSSVVPPNAGTLLQQLSPVQPPPPSESNPGLTIEQPGAQTLPSTTAFLVKRIEISGNGSVDTRLLLALIGKVQGKQVTLAELYAQVGKITEYYHSHGYPLARAIIPAQTISQGVVKVHVIEARYGQIVVNNRSRVNTSLLQGTLSRLKGGQVIGEGDLDRTLLLFSDIPGVAQSATLAPGESAGTADLLVLAEAGPAAAGSVTVDNYGNRYTGHFRAGSEAALYDPLHHGDVLDASVVSSGHDMDSGRIAYDYLLNGRGTRLGSSYSALHYVLGSTLSALDGYGSARVASVWAKQPLVRTRDLNLYGQIEFDHKTLDDNIGVSNIHTDRQLNNWMASFSGDWRDSLMSGGTSSWSLQWLHGTVDFDNDSAEHADAATARIQGPFSQWNATFARLQRLAAQEGLYVMTSGQWTNGNLDPSQKMIAGGPYTVRSYDMSAISGDTGVQASVELRHDFKRAWHGQWQAAIFFDTEHITVNKQVWTSGKNDATLNGAGLGMHWAGPNLWNAKASVAVRIGAAPELINDSSLIHGWIEINKAF